jgi:hypothetical protein
VDDNNNVGDVLTGGDIEDIFGGDVSDLVGVDNANGNDAAVGAVVVETVVGVDVNKSGKKRKRKCMEGVIIDDEIEISNENWAKILNDKSDIIKKRKKSTFKIQVSNFFYFFYYFFFFYFFIFYFFIFYFLFFLGR